MNFKISISSKYKDVLNETIQLCFMISHTYEELLSFYLTKEDWKRLRGEAGRGGARRGGGGGGGGGGGEVQGVRVAETPPFESECRECIWTSHEWIPQRNSKSDRGDS